MTEERDQAAVDRQTLLSQITDLVTKSGDKQDSRWESKIDSLRSDISASRSNLQAAESKYNDGMDTWLQKEKGLVDEVIKSRDSLKSKMKKDWTVNVTFLDLQIANS